MTHDSALQALAGAQASTQEHGDREEKRLDRGAKPEPSRSWVLACARTTGLRAAFFDARRSAHPLERERDALADADAHGREAEAGAAAVELAGDVAGDARARH